MWAAPCRWLWWLWSWLATTEWLHTPCSQWENSHAIEAETKDKWMVHPPLLFSYDVKVVSSSRGIVVSTYTAKNNTNLWKLFSWIMISLSTSPQTHKERNVLHREIDGFVLCHLWPCWDTVHLWLRVSDWLLWNMGPPACSVLSACTTALVCTHTHRTKIGVSNTVVTCRWVILHPNPLCGGGIEIERLFVSVWEKIPCWNVFGF